LCPHHLHLVEAPQQVLQALLVVGIDEYRGYYDFQSSERE
jgi:hypothetical protein